MRRWLSRLEQRLEPYAIPNLTLWLIIAQMLLYGVAISDAEFADKLKLIPHNIRGGEYWRMFSFLLMPPFSHPVLLFFVIYFFYMIGSALEQTWGALRFNLYLLIGYIATVSIAFAFPQLSEVPQSNSFIQTSVFLAFARLFPNFQITLMFVIPVRVYWVALLSWIVIGYMTLFAPSWAFRCMALAPVVNYFIFFGRDILTNARSNEGRMRRQFSQAVSAQPISHRCSLCGLSDVDNPDMDFRYCSKCSDTACYCSQHIHDHPHHE